MFLQLLTNMFQEEWDLPKEVLVHLRVLAPLCGDHPVLLCNILQSQAEQVRLCLEFLAEIFYRVLYKYCFFFLPPSINIIHLRLNVQKHAAANPGKDSCVASSQRKEDLRLTKVCTFCVVKH